MTPSEDALIDLGRALRSAGYSFITPTPETHRRVNARPGNEAARSLRDVFGWSRPFTPDLLPPRMLSLLEAAGALAPHGDQQRSLVRYSTLGTGLFVHSAYPTAGADAVFFGPDTYRFAALARRLIHGAHRLVDIGCGSGAGGLSLGAHAEHITLADINDQALQHARVNAALNGLAERAEIVRSDVLSHINGRYDAVIANPPYLADEGARLYRDGGGSLGIDLSLRITDEALSGLSARGQLLLYTGSPIIDGEDILLSRLLPLLHASGAAFHYVELDPDVFGEELERPAYARVDRIAVVALHATLP